jgi:hypothetical protein
MNSDPFYIPDPMLAIASAKLKTDKVDALSTRRASETTVT